MTVSDDKVRLGQVSTKLNIGRNTILDFLSEKGFKIPNNPNAKLTEEQFTLLSRAFASSANEKREALNLNVKKKANDDADPLSPDTQSRKTNDEEQILIKNLGASEIKSNKESPQKIVHKSIKLEGIKVLGNIDLEKKPPPPASPKKEEPQPSKSDQEGAKDEEKTKQVTPPKETIKAKADTLQGLKVVDKISIKEPSESDKKEKLIASSDNANKGVWKKRPRKRIYKPSDSQGKTKKVSAEELKKRLSIEQEVQKQIRATLAKLSSSQKKSTSAKHRREKKRALSEATQKEVSQKKEELKKLKVTEYISANDLAALMDTSVNEIISTCLNMGMFVSINQRLDAEAITVIADEFGYSAEFTMTTEDETVEKQEEKQEDLSPRPPIVTIMGHVDHGKTSLLDYIRDSKVTAREAGGITQHIGSYQVVTKGGQRITFLDTPGHEAFMAMRARGAKLTDIAVIVVSADDDVMPQTKEAINHAQVAGIPLIVAINKMDKSGADADRIRESLSKVNILVEEWGGKYQCQEISAKTGQGIDDLLEKVLLEAELLDLKVNPNKSGMGSVVEASLDKGRGYVATLMVQEGTLKIGDIVLAGSNFGRVKALIDDVGSKLKSAKPATPVQILGLNGAPTAGEKFRVFKTDREAREVANKREQILREQSVRTKKHITLDEIGRRLALGSFKELSIILKGDVDGSIEALSDSLLKLSTSNIQINIIHHAVGPISESDVLLASASDALIIGFQVRPSAATRKLAEKEKIEIRLYSVIYDAINDVKTAMEGMLEKRKEEVIVGNVEVREIFKISKVGTIAGAMVTDGHIELENPIRLVRDGIVVYSGKLSTLKRFKENVNDVRSGFECGIGIKDFNDIKTGDVIESYEIREVS